MSLDVSLIMRGAAIPNTSSGIFIRENGETKEISEQEWNKRFPNKEPVRVQLEDVTSDEVYSANITHNLGVMADEAGIYEALWRPHRLKDGYNISEDDHEAEREFENKNPSVAKDIIGKLALGLDVLKSDPEHFKKFNPNNGWGDYDGLIEFAENYLKACEQYPDAEIEVSR